VRTRSAAATRHRGIQPRVQLTLPSRQPLLRRECRIRNHLSGNAHCMAWSHTFLRWAEASWFGNLRALGSQGKLKLYHNGFHEPTQA
jgi:hypothetical protein